MASPWPWFMPITRAFLTVTLPGGTAAFRALVALLNQAHLVRGAETVI